MLRAEVLKSLEYIFDPDLELSEEYDLFLRLAYKENFGHLNSTVAVYRIHPKMSSIKNVGKYYDESIKLIENLTDTFRDINTEFPSSILYFYAKTDYYRARSEMRKNNKVAAVQRLSKYKYLSIQFFIIYYLAICGPWFWKRVHIALGRYV